MKIYSCSRVFVEMHNISLPSARFVFLAQALMALGLFYQDRVSQLITILMISNSLIAIPFSPKHFDTVATYYDFHKLEADFTFRGKFKIWAK